MRPPWSQVKGWRNWRKAWTRPWGYCQSRGCEFRTPIADRSSNLRSTTVPPTSIKQQPTTMLTPLTVSDRTEDVQITSQPPLSTLRPHLPIPEVLPPSGTPINIPCGMFDPVQVKQGILQRSPPPPLINVVAFWGWLLNGQLVMILRLKFGWSFVQDNLIFITGKKYELIYFCSEKKIEVSQKRCCVLCSSAMYTLYCINNIH